jgi:2-oxoglutarate dehydrogenase complex dehydrogenase (E1) component-like enzyme
VPNRETASLSEIIECLEKTYCGHFSVEINHLSVSLSEEISKEKEINYHMQNTRNLARNNVPLFIITSE